MQHNVLLMQHLLRKIINDSLRTDVALLYPPYQIALACLHLACILNNKEKEIRNFFADLAVDLEKVTLFLKSSPQRIMFAHAFVF